jgi:hypothetical protein
MHTHRISDVPDRYSLNACSFSRGVQLAPKLPGRSGPKARDGGTPGLSAWTMEISDGANRYDKPIGRSAR